MTSSQDRSALLALARSAIMESLSGKEPPPAELLPEKLPPPQGCGGAFVTLKKNGVLRGCIGLLSSEQPIYHTVAEMARSAAFRDPRFPPLDAGELDSVHIEISRLSEFFPIHPDEIEIGIHGLHLRRGYRSGVFLPQVPVEQGWNLSEYLSGLCRKAGLPDQSWMADGAVLEGFTAEVFSEPQ